MIQKFIEAWELRKDELKATFSEKHPNDYKEIVQAVIGVISNGEYGNPSKTVIHEINDGDYQGTLLYLIPETGYQPSRYWCVKVGYGSCSGCDTLESIRSYGEGKPDKEQVKGYMTLALHIVQGISEIGGNQI